MSNKEHYLWTEKYRPTELDQFVSNALFFERLQRWIEQGDIPHLLLHGPAGTGKSSVAKIIGAKLECSVLSINASDENGIEVIRNKLRDFAMGVSLHGIKIAVLDEADYLTVQGQAALREMMERFSMNTRFILTANYRERIIEPIQSRCQTFEIHPQKRADVAQHLEIILIKEEIKFSLNDIVVLVDAYYPDMRSMIGDMQQCIVPAPHTAYKGRLVIPDNRVIAGEYLSEIVEVLKEAGDDDKLNRIRQIIADSKVRDFTPLYRKLFDNVEKIVPGAVPVGILAIAEGLVNDSQVSDHEINAVATLIALLRCQG